MEAHNFNILESKIKQAIDEINKLKRENVELRSRMNETSTSENSVTMDFDSKNKSELLQKVDEMLHVLDKI
ncbi:MAG: cell division protein ZapB [Candidatus Marinimicrobia bacterium]|nr:cell division protein ZapB [Candidatus Neomarinimicrobiota bacterium]TFB10977.1 cell division protein ZapB [Candidatus Marinimicrobia bacterium MT.SAG.2]